MSTSDSSSSTTVLVVPMDTKAETEILLILCVITYMFIFIVIQCFKFYSRRRSSNQNSNIETGIRNTSHSNISVNILAYIPGSRFDDHAGSETGINNRNKSSALIIESLRISQQSVSSLNKISDQTTDCGICLEPWDEEGKQEWILPCKHKFHSECICEWVKSSGTSCPFCRSIIINVEV
ncbi:hypothetical protein FRX31_034550 [Thalictrum thalictroides]|uniref:RING-type domain-containing protein n=1 Tax=Thalictrum thalictroides TaxID=46969 RepID=A0A7J6UTG8_THATH|nr:hypothetical protein FRX31_034550 [Thalictrum thalictroides]